MDIIICGIYAVVGVLIGVLLFLPRKGFRESPVTIEERFLCMLLLSNGGSLRLSREVQTDFIASEYELECTVDWEDGSRVYSVHRKES